MEMVRIKNQSWMTKIGFSVVIIAMAITIVPTRGIIPTIGTVKVEAASNNYYTTDSLNLRSGASTKHKVLTIIPKGKQVSYVSKSGSWSKIIFGSKTGYVSSKYLKPTKSAVKAPAVKYKTTYKTTANLSLRAGGSVKYKRLTTIPKAKAVTMISYKSSWSKVKYGSKTGYVSSKYLKSTKVAVKPAKKVVTIYPAPSTKTPGKYVDGVLIVNKIHGLPSSYNPGVNAIAQHGVNAMIADAKRQGVSLNAFSAYRSYSYQAQLYSNYTKKYGKARADRFSARPGHSEHQTGLAFDFGGKDRSHWLEESFASTKEGKWLYANAHKYGFILRYHKGKESITGYMYEPWHYRYVGRNVSTKVKTSGKTLEEYLGIAEK
jgi:zinc D-Ala-D-Ala carboxypeptidase